MGLIFKSELIGKILTGQKTQTRRPVKAGDDGWKCYDIMSEPQAVYRHDRLQWQVGRDYAIVPGRGKHSIYARQCMNGVWEWQSTQPGGDGGEQWKPRRIRIARIRQEDARNISHADALAEGFSDKYGFLQVWTNFYDPKMGSWALLTEYDPVQPDHCPRFLWDRPDDLYQCWALTFEMVTP